MIQTKMVLLVLMFIVPKLTCWTISMPPLFSISSFVNDSMQSSVSISGLDNSL